MHSKDEGCGDGNGAVCVHTTNIKILHFALSPQHWIVFPCSLPGSNEGQEEQHKPLLCALQRCESAKVVWVLLGPLCWHGKVSFFPPAGNLLTTIKRSHYNELFFRPCSDCLRLRKIPLHIICLYSLAANTLLNKADT